MKNNTNVASFFRRNQPGKPREQNIDELSFQTKAVVLPHGDGLAPITAVTGKGARSDLKKASWEDLEHLYRVEAQGLLNLMNDYNSIVNLVNMSGVVLEGEDVTSIMATIKNDYNRFESEIVQIYSQHAGKSGYVNNADEHALYLEIYNKYQSFSALLLGTGQTHSIALTEISLAIRDHLHEREKNTVAQPVENIDNV